MIPRGIQTGTRPGNIYNMIQIQREKMLIVIDNVETIEQDQDIERLGDLPC